MNYQRVTELDQNDGPQQGRSILVDGLLFVGDKVVAEWHTGDSSFSMRPAAMNGVQGFILTEDFCASERGNVAEWRTEEFVPLREGIELALKNEAWGMAEFLSQEDW